MTSTPTPPLLGDCDDPAAVLGFARRRKADEDRAARDVLEAAARWVSMHSTDTLVGPVDAWHERALPVGGEGCPEVAEFAVAEFAAALGKSTESGRRYLARAVEGHDRLTRCWSRLEAGDLPAWKLGMIADATMALSPAAAAFVDQHVAPVGHKIGPAQLMRLVEEAKALVDPEQTEADRQAAAGSRKFDVDLAGVGVDGVVRVDGGLDLADALDLETAVADLAHRLLLAGDDSPLDVRRSKALGLLARGQHTLDHNPGQDPGQDTGQDTGQDAGAVVDSPDRQMVLHVHLSDAALAGAGGLARVDEVAGPVTAEQVRQWCGTADVVVKPVIDLAERIQVQAYEIPDRLRDQIRLRDGTCVFPHCTRKAGHCDLDHVQPYDRGGTTSSDNLALLCRRHHRHKTTGGWTYWLIEPGLYLWRSPHGHYYVRDNSGTSSVTARDDLSQG